MPFAVNVRAVVGGWVVRGQVISRSNFQKFLYLTLKDTCQICDNRTLDYSAFSHPSGLLLVEIHIMLRRKILSVVATNL